MEGYFHSTRLMQALRMGLLRVRQKRARGGLLLVELPCFLLLAYCCLFLWVREPTGADPAGAEPTTDCPLIVWGLSPLALLAALIAACQDRLAGWGCVSLERDGLSDHGGGASPEGGALVPLALFAPEEKWGQRKV